MELVFNFEVDKAMKTIVVKRDFRATLPLVWKAWTTPELLDQWWGPAPWHTETKTMDFQEGGYWLYAMVGPEGQRHWSKMHYQVIVPLQRFGGKDGFCDENGVMDTTFPINSYENRFAENGSVVRVTATMAFDRLEDLEKIIAMGFREGFTMGLNQLEQLLLKL